MPTLTIKERGYAHPELLADSAWLAEHLNDPKVRIVDVRPADQYAAGHIPGAVNLATAGNIPREPNGDMGAPEAFAGLAAKLGISHGMTVVAYEGTQAGLLVWALRFFGHDDARYLDGGAMKWTAEERAQSMQAHSYPLGTFTAKPIPAQYCSLSQAKAAAGDGSVVFWDVRSPEEYSGARPMGNLPAERSGHIPNAVNLDWNDLFDPITKTMKSATECRSMLVARGVKPEAEIVTY